MKHAIIAGIALAVLSSNAHGAGKHAGGHDDADSHRGEDRHAESAIGKPGKADGVARELTVTMKETDDGDMIFEPASIEVSVGETVRFVVVNAGELVHEFVLGDNHEIMDHKAMMEKWPEMEHDDPNSVRLEPGAQGEVIWQFAGAGSFEFACLIPGHYDAGMKGSLVVDDDRPMD